MPAASPPRSLAPGINNEMSEAGTGPQKPLMRQTSAASVPLILNNHREALNEPCRPDPPRSNRVTIEPSECHIRHVDPRQASTHAFQLDEDVVSASSSKRLLPPF